MTYGNPAEITAHVSKPVAGARPRSTCLWACGLGPAPDRVRAGARQQLDEALAAFGDIGDRPAEARALRELGLLLRDQGHLAGSDTALNGSHAIFEALGDSVWVARLLASKAALEEARGGDSASLMNQARALCRQGGITAEEKITGALREW
jgi:hypothetical protein